MKHIIILLSILIGQQAVAQETDFNIIKYNNPGLVVDLEVGLWPIPIPVDYDGDGLTDILVSVTSFPVKGLFYYRNVGDKKNPLFDKPVRIADGFNNIYPSYVNGELRVLRPGGEYKNFKKDLYSKPEGITVDNDPLKDVKKTRSNKWSYVDYDNDGDQDIIVGIDEWSDYGWDNAFDKSGKWTNGPLHGYVYLLENRNGEYINKGKIMAGANPVDSYGYPCPMVCDFDGDGDLDIICGEFVDKLTWHENIGTREKPVYKEGRYLKNDDGLIKMYLEMFVPVAFDFDGDGRMDILAGEEDGRIAFIRNTGQVKDNMPQFESPVYLKQKADNVKFGALVTPFSIDWDGDGDMDIIAGNSAGDLSFIENLTGGENPTWAAPVFLKANDKNIRIQAGENGSIQGPCEAKWGYTVPTVADWDMDGKPDIIINSIWGEVLWFRNTGSLTNLEGPLKMNVDWGGKNPPKPAWFWWNPGKTDLVSQWRTSAVAIDWNKDGLTDLVMLDHEGYLSFYERFKKGKEYRLKPGKRIFYLDSETPSLLRLNEKQAGASGRRKFCFADWDKDGDLDIIINSVNIDLLENVREENGKFYFKEKGNLGKTKLAGHTTCPTVTDWDKDGRIDALVGAEDGHLYLLKNTPPPPGTIVNHITKETGLYIGSPSICILPDGTYVASHDEFGPKSTEYRSAKTRVFVSRDKGANWEQAAVIDGQFWSNLFVHKGELFIMGPNKHHGNLQIRKSLDGGHTWTVPFPASNGLLIEGEYHTAPMPMVVHNGRIWRAVEYATSQYTQWGKRYSAMVVSAPVDADLLDADSWQKSNYLMYDSTYLDGKFEAWLEGNVVVDPDGNMVDILRVAVPAGHDEYAAIVDISADGKTASFNPRTGFIKFPGGAKKFSIRYDKESGRYWMLANYTSPEFKDRSPGSVRNKQALCSSKDLRNWDIHQIVIEHPEVVYHGWQYVDWQFEGDDIIFLSRTAFDDVMGGARNNHDANFLTFHRIKDFRKLVNNTIFK